MTKRFSLFLLGFYRYWISPSLHSVFPGGCRYQPTCSQYAVEAIGLYGAARGGWMGICRLMRCHPFAHGGFDPVPLPAAAISPPPVLTSKATLVRGVGTPSPANHYDPLP